MIQIINGPNLNVLGRREPTVYGSQTFEDILAELRALYPEQTINYFQSNSEGELITRIQAAGADCTGIVLNAGAYTHTSLALADAIASMDTPVIEVHMSNVFAREEIRHRSLIASKCIGSISGLGKDSYFLAMHYFVNRER